MSDIKQESDFSERGEDFFDEPEEQDTLALLAMRELYLKHNEQSAQDRCQDFLDSPAMAKHFINQLIKHTEEVIYEKELEKRLPEHAVISLLLMNERHLEMAFQVCDDSDMSQAIPIEELEDPEPGKPVPERWARSKVVVDHIASYRLQEMDTEEGQTMNKTGTMSEITSVYGRARRVKKKDDDGQQLFGVTEAAVPQDMHVAEEPDELIDRLRLIKQQETKRREEKEQQDKKDKQKPIDFSKKDIRNAKFTYDFDGQLINTKSVKTERLPPASYAINYSFSNQEPQQQQVQNQSQKFQRQLSKPQQSNRNSTKNNNTTNSSTNIPSSSVKIPGAVRDEYGLGLNNKQAFVSKNPFSYDDFSLNTGVKLIYEQQEKEGPRGNEIFDSLENMDLKLRGQNEPLHITRSEYRRLTENGNLNMASSIRTVQDNILKQHAVQKSSETGLKTSQQTTSLGKEILPNSAFFGKTETKSKQINKKYNESPFKEILPNHSILVHESKSKITVAQPRLIRQVLTEESEDLSEQTPKQFAKTVRLPAISQEHSASGVLKKSPVDEFNQSILKNSTEWGKGRVGSQYYYGGKVVHKPDQKVLRTTLNQFYKLPRERDIGQSLKLSKSSLHNTSNNVGSKSENATMHIFPEGEFRGSFYTSNSKFSETLRSSRG